MAGNRTLKLSILADVDNLKKNLDSGGKEVDGFGGKLEKFGKVAAAAFAAAAAAAVAYAGKLAIDGVKAAIEDEAAQQKLALALKNVTGATNDQIDSIEKQINKISLATGVADDALRPAFQRLAVATGDVDKAQRLLNIALDVSAGTGKPLEAVTNALGKAYEGNTSSLARLGIGMGAAELKALGLEGSVSKLAETFRGASENQANTFQGRMERIKVAFDEAKETIGTALLPILEKFLKFITENVLPIVQQLSDAFAANKDGLNKRFQETYEFIKSFIMPIFEAYKEAFYRIKDAIMDNKERFKEWFDSLRDIWDWANKYLVPLFRFIIVEAIELMAKRIEITIRALVPVIEVVTKAITFLINSVIDRINALIALYNLVNGLWGGKDVQSIQKIGETGGTSTSLGKRPLGPTSIPKATPSTGGGVPSGGGIAGGAGSATAATNAATAAANAAESAAKAVEKITTFPWMPTPTGNVANSRAFESGDVLNIPGSITSTSAFDPARFRAGESGNVNIYVSGALDAASVARQINDILTNESTISGTYSGLGQSRFSPTIQ